MTREPALISGAVQALLAVLISLGVVDLSADQVAAIMGAVAAVLALVVRAKVTPHTPDELD